VECGSYAITSNVDADNDAVFHARLCELKIWSDFDGYGFELHADDKNDVKYMYITKIEAGSPAEAVGKCCISWLSIVISFMTLTTKMVFLLL